MKSENPADQWIKARVLRGIEGIRFEDRNMQILRDPDQHLIFKSKTWVYFCQDDSECLGLFLVRVTLTSSFFSCQKLHSINGLRDI